MSVFGGMISTNRGRLLQAKAQTGVELHFTRIAVGDGALGGTSILELNALKNEVKSLEIKKLKVLPEGNAVAGTALLNTDLASGFYWRELGLFAQDPDAGEVLYCYGNAGTNAEYIPAGGGPDIKEKIIDIITIIGNASNVTATINQSLVYASQQDIQHLQTQIDSIDIAGTAITVNQSQVPTSPGNGNISNLFSWIANRIKTITGRDNWWEAPAITLEGLANKQNLNAFLDIDTSDPRWTGSKKADANCWNGWSIYANTSTSATVQLAQITIDTLRFCDYVLIVTLCSSNITFTTNAIQVSVQKNESGTYTTIATSTFKASDFSGAYKYKSFRMNLDYKGPKATNNQLRIVMQLLPQTSVYEVRMESLIIMPVGLGTYI
ncbi:tail-collar fiber protein [Anaerobacterium chartisolvens]|uniref:Tail-collar fiber protein n=1 Tax=Anaerobacterium chartisolvens TaxID=1297424 RepID=A0A369BH41_9FIRM|nr:phage tail protein [Anaerobacterium chartisolvens]RCX20870.1 tail-collar fiber protein [Anaerobacterium chartisolvens]